MSRCLTLACLFVVVMVSSAGAQTPYSADLLPTRTALARIGLERHWSAVVPLTASERLIEVSIDDDLMFTQTNRGNFSVYNAESGQFLWTLNLGMITGDAHPASANSFAVFVTNANMLYALDRATGRQMWTERLPAVPSSPTACDEGRVMVGLNNGKIYAFGLKTKNAKSQPVISPRPLTLWNWATGGPIPARPHPAGAVVAFGSLDGRAYVCLAEMRTMLWRYATGGEIAAPLGTHGTRTLMIPSSDKNVYAVDLWTAETKWVFPCGAPVRQEPMVSDDDVYVVNTSGALFSLNAETGLQQWETTTLGGKLMAISAKRIYLETQDEDLFIVDRATGTTVAEPRATRQRAGVNLREYTLGLTNNLNDRIFMATPSGMVICLRESGQINPRPLHDPKAKPFAYIPPDGVKLPKLGEKYFTPRTNADPNGPPPGENAAPAENKDKPEEKDAAPTEPDEKDKDKDKPADEPK